MQLLIGDHAIVYDMAGREVAMLNKLKEFGNPFEFEHTGFVYKLADRSYETDATASLAV